MRSFNSGRDIFGFLNRDFISSDILFKVTIAASLAILTILPREAIRAMVAINLPSIVRHQWQKLGAHVHYACVIRGYRCSCRLAKRTRGLLLYEK